MLSNTNFKLKSHPDKLLYNHLKQVGDASKKEILSKNLNLTVITKEQLADISYLIGISHDFGKGLSGFQKYITGTSEIGPNHSPVSSIFAFELIKQYCIKNKINPIFYWLGYLCVKKHHSNLTKIDFDDLNKYDLNDQINELKKNEEIKLIYLNLVKEYDIKCDKIINSLSIKEIKNYDSRRINTYLKNLSDEKSIELYLLSEFLFSLLIDFDKKDAANILHIKTIPVELSPEIVEDYISSKIRVDKQFDPNKPLNKLKNKFYKCIVNNTKVSKEKYLYTITAQTGIGKTLTSFSLAMRIRNIVSQEYKIHYILPFTTLINQNFDVFSDVIKNKFKDFNEDESNYILKHHYLSSNEIKRKDTEYSKHHNYLDELLFIKSWESNVIVSTYIQLLKTILGSRNSFLNKLHNIINSIIILDEVQFIGNKYWELINKIFNVFSSIFKTYFILMTATQPKIFSKDEAVELSNNTFSKSSSNQRKIIYEKENKTINEFKAEVLTDISKNNYNRIIIVVNTKNCARLLYEKLNTSLDNFKLIYLSKNLLPVEIDKRIKEIKNLKEKSKYIIITTQLIEAGVDISSDILYRDITVAPSLIQSAGRCNRFNEIKQGIVKVIRLIDDTNKLYAHKIYDASYIQRTEEILNQTCDEYKIVNEFFNKIAGDKNSDELFYKIKRLSFQEVDDSFELIQKDFPKEHIFIEFNAEAINLFKTYKELISKNTKRDFKLIGTIKKLRKQMELYSLDINPRDFKLLLDEGIIKKFKEIKYIPNHVYKKVYNKEIGFYTEKLLSEKNNPMII